MTTATRLDDGCDAWFAIERPPEPAPRRVYAKGADGKLSMFEGDPSLEPHRLIGCVVRQGFRRAMVVVK